MVLPFGGPIYTDIGTNHKDKNIAHFKKTM